MCLMNFAAHSPGTCSRPGLFSTVRRQLALPADRLNYVGLIVVLGILEEGAAAAGALTERRIFETVGAAMSGR